VIVTYIFSARLEDRIRVQLRCRNLADALNRTGAHRANLLDIDAFAQNTPEAQKICAASDLLVIYRYLCGPMLNAVEYWQARDKKVIVDFDQALNHLTPEMPDYAFWQSSSLLLPPPLEQFKWGLGMVDAATTVSARLVDDWSQYTHLYELPDYLNTCQYPIPEQTHAGELWLGLGQGTCAASLKNTGLAAALEAVCREKPQTKLVLCASQSCAAAKLDIAPEQIIRFTPGSFDEWVNLLLQLDLGLAPAAGDYALRASPVNLLEFMIAKIPWIATEQLAFRPLTPYGRWVQNTPQAWETTILETLAHLAVYKKKAAREPFLFALGQDVSANIDKVLKIYTAIINQSPG
jgi:hypothetical protein